MAMKAFKELKNLTRDELTTRIREGEKNLFRGRVQKTTGQLENTASLTVLRKNLARMKMLLGDLDRKAKA